MLFVYFSFHLTIYKQTCKKNIGVLKYKCKRGEIFNFIKLSNTSPENCKYGLSKLFSITSIIRVFTICALVLPSVCDILFGISSLFIEPTIIASSISLPTYAIISDHNAQSVKMLKDIENLNLTVQTMDRNTCS